LFSVEQCELRRNAVAEDVNPEFSGFKSKCNLLWYSITDVSQDWNVANQ
jgi:hypothetical protein